MKVKQYWNTKTFKITYQTHFYSCANKKTNLLNKPKACAIVIQLQVQKNQIKVSGKFQVLWLCLCVFVCVCVNENLGHFVEMKLNDGLK